MTNEKDKALIHSAAESAMERLDKAVEVKTGTLDLRGGNQREGFQIWLEDAMLGVLTTARKEEREAAFKEAADYIRRQWLAAYPVEVFPEPPKPPAECSRDRISAAMGRHMAMRLIEHFEAAASSKGANDSRRQ